MKSIIIKGTLRQTGTFNAAKFDASSTVRFTTTESTFDVEIVDNVLRVKKYSNNKQDRNQISTAITTGGDSVIIE